jgi:3-hydroxyisobutyrate dehydrogenase-like beta-hydroxyacid dehydrogenase
MTAACETIGFIGLGSQGGPMAQRIGDAGMPLVVWARRPEALEPYTARGAVAAASVAELGARCDHVGICVIDDADVLGITDELIPAMKSGSRIAVHSTILPETCTWLDAACRERGIELIDAPVSGGGPGAAAGTLTVMCGATPKAFDAALPVFQTFGKEIVLLGGVGAGQRAKIVNNSLMAANMGLAHAAMAAADALGIDRAAFADLVKESSGRSFSFEVYARLPSPAAFSTGAPLLAKDIGLLGAVLPGNAGAEALRDAAEPFLTAANGGRSPS